MANRVAKLVLNGLIIFGADQAGNIILSWLIKGGKKEKEKESARRQQTLGNIVMCQNEVDYGGTDLYKDGRNQVS
jgi:hypothetical protein